MENKFISLGKEPRIVVLEEWGWGPEIEDQVGFVREG
jgi:hypothetical protein